MGPYKRVKRTDENFRNAVFIVYGKKCFYCGIKINMHQLELDHIIPVNDNLKLDSEQLDVFLEELGENNFTKESLINFLPSCGHCNKLKSNHYYAVGSIRFYMEETLRRASKVIEEMERFKFKYEAEDKAKDMEIIRLKDEREYTKEKIIKENYHQCVYTYGLGEVRITASLPIDIKQELSCMLMFAQEGLSDSMFVLNEKEIESYFFAGYGTGVSYDRNFIWHMEEASIGISLPNVRFTSARSVAEQLSVIFDDLYVEFHVRKENLLNTIGANYFQEMSKNSFAIISLPKYIWIDMVDFAQSHDRHYGTTEWDIFQALNLTVKNRIIIYPNHEFKEPDASILAKLYVEDLNGYYVDILWEPGYTPNVRAMEGFDNKIKWKADFTHDWIIEEFIPYIFYLSMINNRNRFQRLLGKQMSFEEFKEQFNYKEVEIQSLMIG